MEIRYLGHACFWLKGKSASVVCDPFDPVMTGLKFPKIEASIVTISHDHKDHNQSQLVDGNPLIINLSGEYEKQGIRISGFSVFHDKKQGLDRGKNLMFKIEIEGVSILHCGDLGHIISDDLIDEIGEIQVLAVPVGGFYTIDAEEAVAIAKKIEPSIIIPMHYNQPKLNQEVFGKLSKVADFLNKMGLSTVEPVNKLTLKKEEFGQEEIKTVVMEAV